MKLLKFSLENARSFLESAELSLDGQMSIIIGPNGGGKTNLLDSISLTLWRHFFRNWNAEQAQSNEGAKRIRFRDVGHPGINRHFSGSGRSQVVKISLEVAKADIENIKSMTDFANESKAYIDENWEGTRLTDPPIFNESLTEGSIVNFTIENDQIVSDLNGNNGLILKYLQQYSLHSIARSQIGVEPLGIPALFFPTLRSSSGFSNSFSASSYASFNDINQRSAASSTHSRNGGNLVNYAIGQFAKLHCDFKNDEKGKASDRFKDNEKVKALTKALKSIGYDWDLSVSDHYTNEYRLELKKQNTTLLFEEASSGERELLTYIFVIYGLDIRGALIIVDEPELHLHPKWQFLLLDLFERLSEETGNQFLLATHSPSFISPKSIQYVSRIYSVDRASRIKRLDNMKLPESRHLFSIINTQNNEKIFFCDLVILVEGITDRIFLEKVFDRFSSTLADGLATSYEIVDVGGKVFFDAYKKVLSSCDVPHVIIADLDYCMNVGTSEIKEMFEKADLKASKEIVKPASLDGKNLILAIDSAIGSKDFSELQDILTYIQHRHAKLVELGDEEARKLKEFIRQKATENVYILSLGSIEAYMPPELRSKKLGQVIELRDRDDFWELLPEVGRAELELVATKILQLNKQPI